MHGLQLSDMLFLFSLDIYHYLALIEHNETIATLNHMIHIMGNHQSRPDGAPQNLLSSPSPFDLFSGHKCRNVHPKVKVLVSSDLS